MKVKIVIDGIVPIYATEDSAGADLYAKIDNPVLLGSLDRHTFPTGVKIALPKGYEAQVRPRSGMAKKNGVVAILGTIDADYRGEIGVTLINLSTEPYRVMPNDRIAQLVVSKYEKVEWEQVDELDTTTRGEQGFGHSGRN